MLNSKIKKIKLPKNILFIIQQPGVTNIQGYKMGELVIILDKTKGKWHLSVSHPYRLPSFNELETIKASLLPGVQLELISIGRAVQFMEPEDANIN